MSKMQFKQSSILAGGAQTYLLSDLIDLVPDANSPATLAIRVYDRDAYSGVQSYDYGFFTSPIGGKISAGTQYKPTTIYFDLKNGVYVSRDTGEALSAYQFTTSNQNFRSVYLSLFTHAEAGASYSGNWLDPKWAHVSDMNVVTRNDYVDLSPNYATAEEIAAIAKGFIGKVWNDQGCWLLASNISAAAGASLPIASAKVGAQDIAGNTQWQVVFNGAQQVGDWRELLKPGDIVEMGFYGGKAHIATVTSGEGHAALWVDNSGLSANTGSAADIIIQGEHSVEDASYNAIDKTVVIFRLASATQDATTLPTVIAPPVVTSYSQSIQAGQSLPLRSLFSVKDPNLLPMVSYQIVEANGSSHLELNGATNLATVAQQQSGITIVSAADLSKVTYSAALGPGSLTITAFDGQGWGSAKVTVTGWKDQPPIVTGESISVHAQSQLLPMSSLFSVSVPAGHTITEYRFIDKDHSGQLLFQDAELNIASNEEAALGIYRVSASHLDAVNWKALAATGTISVSAFDGVQWSDFSDITVAGLNRAPTVTPAARQTIMVGQEVSVASFFSLSDVDNDAVQLVSIYDYFQNIHLNGAHDYCPEPHTYQVKVSELGKLTYTAPSLMGGVQGWSVYASDGTSWSRPVGVLFTIADARPIVQAKSASPLGVGQTLPLSEFMFALDPFGKTITKFAIKDPTGGGSLHLNGASNLASAEQISQSVVVIAAGEIDKLSYSGANQVGSEVLTISAFNGENWGSADIAFYTSDQTSPNVRATPSNIDVGSTVNLSDFILASTASGKPIVKYRISDPAGSGNIKLNGATDIATSGESSQGIVVSASDFLKLQYRATQTDSHETLVISAFDGGSWGQADLLLTSKNFHRPVVTTTPITLHAGESISVQDLFQVYAPDGGAMQYYQINDSGGHLNLNGAENIWAAQQYQGIYGVRAKDLVKIVYTAGAVGSDTIYIEASDDKSSSMMMPLAITVLPNPVIIPTTVTLAIAQTAALKDLFTVTNPSGKAITQYKIIDPLGGGTVYLNGASNLASYAEQAAGISIINASDLDKLTYQAATSYAVDSLTISAFDGESWGKSVVPATTIDGGAPQLLAAAAKVELDSSTLMSSLVSATSHSAQPISQYKIIDPLGGGRIALNGAKNLATAAQQAQEGWVIVSAADFAKLGYVGADNAGAENLTVSAFDGQSWGAVTLAITSVKTPAPIISPIKTYLNAGQSTSLSGLFEIQKFTTTDIAYYLFQDSGQHIQLNGARNLWAAQQSSGYYWIAGSDLSKLSFSASQDGVYHFSMIVNDGFNYSTWTQLGAVVGKDNLNLPPNVLPLDTTVSVGQAVALSRLFTVQDPLDNAILKYRIVDPAGSGLIVQNGAKDLATDTEHAQGMMVFSAQDFSLLQYQGASTSSVEALTVSAYDGLRWGVADIAITSAILPPKIVAANTSVEINQQLKLSAVFDVTASSGKAITQYKIQDPQGGGSVQLNGATNLADAAQQAQGIFLVSANELGKLSYAAASQTGKETLLIAAYDGQSWGASNIALSMVDNRPPKLIQTLTKTDINSSTWLASFFSGISISGRPIVEYQIQDPEGGGKVLINSAHDLANGAQKNQNITVVSAFDLGAVLYVGAATAASETLKVTAYDGVNYSTMNLPIQSVTSVPPVVTVKPLIMHQGDSLYLSDMFAVTNPNGYALKSYNVTDPDLGIKLNGAANGYTSDLFDYQGHYYLYPADWSKVQYVAPSLGTVRIGIQVDDGRNVSQYVEQVITKVSSADKAVIVGTANDDYLVYSGQRSNFSIQKNGDSYTIIDKRPNGHTETIKQIEHLVFSDFTVSLTAKSDAGTIPVTQLNSLIELYIAYLNRVPEADGLSYWVQQVKQGTSIDQVADFFYSAAVLTPLQSGFSAGMSNSDYVKIIYKNILGRAGAFAPSDADVQYWANNLSSGTETRTNLVKTMLGAAHGFKGDANWGWVADLLDNKIQVAKIFALDDGLNYNNANLSIQHGMEIAAAITATDTMAALRLVGISEDYLIL